jgi:hypothetical protein
MAVVIGSSCDNVPKSRVRAVADDWLEGIRHSLRSDVGGRGISELLVMAEN